MCDTAYGLFILLQLSRMAQVEQAPTGLTLPPPFFHFAYHMLRKRSRCCEEPRRGAPLGADGVGEAGGDDLTGEPGG